MWAFGAALALAAAGCGASALATVASSGDWIRLRTSLRERLQGAPLSAGEAREVALAVARRELADASEAAALGALERLSGCVTGAEDSIRAALGRDDDVGAAALLVLVSAGRASASDARALGDARMGRLEPSQQAPWRAARARGLFGASDGDERRLAFVDGDERVRLAALLAASDARDPADLEAALEAARLDPLPAAQRAAIAAVGRIGGEPAVLGLLDLWPRAEPAAREAIVLAWAEPASVATGGARQLARVVSESVSAPAIVAAAALATSGAPEADEALGALLTAALTGTTGDRVRAVSLLPGAAPGAGDHPRAKDVTDALVAAARDSDDVVALAGVRRLLRAASLPEGVTRAELVKRLIAIAEHGGADGLQAKLALVSAGEKPEALGGWLSADAESADPLARAAASRAHARLGDFGRAALGLADDLPAVRSSAVCALVSPSE